jgi:hypothetical protein
VERVNMPRIDSPKWKQAFVSGIKGWEFYVEDDGLWVEIGAGNYKAEEVALLLLDLQEALEVMKK